MSSKGLWVIKAAGIVLVLVAFFLPLGSRVAATQEQIKKTTPQEQGTFVYTNNHVDSVSVGGFNAVTGFSVGSNGALTNIGTFTTLGQASGNAVFGEQGVVVCPPSNRLYVTNDLDNSVSGFDINPATGNLTIIPGSPFPSGATSEVSLACTPDGSFLMVGGTNVSVLSIAANGTLTPIPGSPFPIDPGQVGFAKAMKITADGQYLFVSGGNRVQPFSIAADGTLTALAKSAPGKRADGLDASCAGTHLYGGQSAVPTAVRGWNVGANADLTTMLPGGRWPGEGWYEGDGKNGAIWVLLSPDERFLFGSNRDYLGVSTPYQVTVFSVNADGRLTNITGQPPSSEINGMGMATNAEGTLLFQASYVLVNNAFVNYVSVFNVAANGVLTHVAGSPFATGISGALLSLAVYPPRTCCTFTLDRDHQSFTGAGGTGTVNVTASDGCAWTASTTATFIHITSGSSGTGNGAVQYSVDSNAGSTIRSDTISIAGHTFTVYQGINFSDVPSSNPFCTEIGKLSARGVTLGCGGGNYCPNDLVTREQMAAFIIRAKGEFNPPTPASQRFQDVPPGNVFYNFIDRLAELQITLGCTPDHLMYCPSDPVKREQMAAFLLRGLGEFNPPTPATQRFADVPQANVFYNFIDRLAVLQITLGCTPDHLMYCPNDSVTRAQMAAFLVRAFNL